MSLPHRLILSVLFAALLIPLVPGPAAADSPGTAFTFQGRITVEGDPAFTGPVDALTFGLHALEEGGVAVASQTLHDVAVSGGLFSVQLDFGEHPAWSGGERWLELTVEHDSGSETLSPRFPVSSAPYAIRARTATAAEEAATLGGLAPSDFLIHEAALGRSAVGRFTLTSTSPPLVVPLSWLDIQFSGGESGGGGGGAGAPVRLDHLRLGFHATAIPVELMTAGLHAQTVDARVELFHLGERDVVYTFELEGFRPEGVGVTLPGDIPQDQILIELYCGANCESLSINSDLARDPAMELDFQLAVFDVTGAARDLAYVHLEEGFAAHPPPEPPASYSYRSANGGLAFSRVLSGGGGGASIPPQVAPITAERPLDESLLQALAYLVRWPGPSGQERTVEFTAGTFRTAAVEDGPGTKLTPVLTRIRFVDDDFARVMRWRVHGSGAAGVTEEFDVMGRRYEFSVEYDGTEHRFGYNATTNTPF